MTEEQLAGAPQVTPMLKKAKGGLKAVLEAMRFSREDQNISIFISKYDSIPADDRERLSWEAIAIAAGIEPTYLLGSAMLAMQAFSVNMVKILALSNHSAVMERRIEFAQQPGGYRDRDALDVAMGFLPQSKGIAIYNNNSSNTNKEPKHASEVPAEHVLDGDGNLDHMFPRMAHMQEDLVPIRRRQLTDGN